MREVLNTLGKIRGRSIGELRTRSAQLLRARAERFALSARARVPDDAAFLKLIDARSIGRPVVSAEALLDNFRARTAPRFFGAFADAAETVRQLRLRFGAGAEAEVVARARRIVAGRFDLLGLRDLDFGDPPDWHREPVSGIVTPRTHWSRIDFLDATRAGDKKITWELNRHQYLSTLGRAYWYTRDELYAETFVRHVTSWIDENPPKEGINWASSLEVSFRAMSWLWALHFFKDSPSLTPQFFLRVLKLLYVHGGHLEAYLSTYFSPNTHLTGEALGLFHLGTLLPELRSARRWRSAGEEILLAELDRQVRPDGVYFEQSSYYHRYTTDFYTHFLILLRSNGRPVEGRLEQKLTALLDHLMHVTRPDGTTPLFGDDDGGRLVTLDERAPNDFRAALSTGAALFGRPDYKYVAGEAAEETLWLLGAEGLREFDRLEASPPAQRARAFADGGYYVMRDDWSRESNYLMIDCGPHGSLRCGHAHADALSFELASRGRTLLVDPGTYTYTGSAELRDYFRGSAAHNTLTIDGESSSVPDGPFSWKHVARAAPRSWVEHRRFCYFEGGHDGYERLATPAAHTRRVLFIRDGYCVIRDGVETAGTHRYGLHFHFAPGCRPALESEADAAAAVRERPEDGPGLEIHVFGGGGAWREDAGWVSACYRERRAAPVFTFTAAGAGAQEFITFLVPRRAGDGKTYVREIEAERGRAFEILDAGARDVLIVGGAGRTVRAAGIVSDFDLTWARLARGSERVEEFVALGGRILSFDDAEALPVRPAAGGEGRDSSGKVVFAAGRRVGAGLRVDTDSVEDIEAPARPGPAWVSD